MSCSMFPLESLILKWAVGRLIVSIDTSIDFNVSLNLIP